MAHDVFISHAIKDKPTADAVCAMLEASGIRCWIAPRDVTPGMEWGECIIEAIEKSRIMVLVFTTHANGSPQIRREIERAVNHGVAILPLRIEDVLPGKALEYFIGNVHWLDALTPPLETHLRNLADTVKVLLARMVPREAAAPVPPVQPVASAPPKSKLTEPVVAERKELPSKAASPTPSGVFAAPAEKPAARTVWLRTVLGGAALLIVLVVVAYIVKKSADAEAHNNLAIALYKKGQYDEAIAEYRRAIALKPDLAGAHYWLGVAFYAKRQYDEAIAEYRSAIALKPDYAEAHNNLGSVLYRMGKSDEAIAEYRKAIALKPDFAYAHNNLGLALANKGQFDEAIAEYRKAIALKPDDAYAHNNLAQALHFKGQHDDAIAEYRKFIALKPDDATAHHNLGEELRAKGQLGEAIAEFRKVVALKPDDANAHYFLGLALEKAHKLDEAQREFDRARALTPK
jgi:Flp pilus assembly protein TadD